MLRVAPLLVFAVGSAASAATSVSSALVQSENCQHSEKHSQNSEKSSSRDSQHKASPIKIKMSSGVAAGTGLLPAKRGSGQLGNPLTVTEKAVTRGESQLASRQQHENIAAEFEEIYKDVGGSKRPKKEEVKQDSPQQQQEQDDAGGQAMQTEIEKTFGLSATNNAAADVEMQEQEDKSHQTEKLQDVTESEQKPQADADAPMACPDQTESKQLPPPQKLSIIPPAKAYGGLFARALLDSSAGQLDGKKLSQRRVLPLVLRFQWSDLTRFVCWC